MAGVKFDGTAATASLRGLLAGIENPAPLLAQLGEYTLRMYGSLDNSKTSIGAGKLLLNTIGGLTMGVVDVLGSVVEGTWKLFR